ncbi:MAG: Ig-like domain repeat protein [Terracidiphilus sp.]
MTIDSSGCLYLTDTGLNALIKLTPSGGGYTQTTIAKGFNSPQGLAVDSSGNLFIADGNNNQVVKETLSGGVYTQSVIVTGLADPCGVSVDSYGNLYIADTNNHRVLLESLSGGAYTQSVFSVPGLDMPFGVAVDRYNNVYVADTYHNKILMETLTASGTYLQSAIQTSKLYYPDGVAIDRLGNIYISDDDNGRVIEETLSGVNFGAIDVGSTSSALSLSFVFDAAGVLGPVAVLAQGAAGLDFANAGTGTCVTGTNYAAAATCTVNVTFAPVYSGMRSGAVVLENSSGAPIATGYIYGSGTGPQVNFLAGTETTVAASGLNSPNGFTVDGQGNVFFADYGNNPVVKETLAAGGYTQSLIGSAMNQPGGVAVDGSGNLYVSDTGNFRVLKETLTANGYVQSVLPTPGLSYPYGVAVDGSGNVYITDTTNNRILMETLTPNGYVQSAIGSGLLYSFGVAVDGSGNVYIADTLNNRVVKETLTAGNYTQSNVGGGLSLPYGIAVDGNGSIYIADTFNNRITKEAVTNGSYYQTTTAGNTLAHPYGVAVDGRGNVYVADTVNNRILKEDLADPPSRSFPPTAVGSTSAGQALTLDNIGNAALTFSIPTTGNNPSIAANFTLSGYGNTPCTILNANSPAPATLASEASCQVQISFAPTVRGTINGTLAITDNALNAVAPGYATQYIPLKGSGNQGLPAITWAAPAAINYGTALSATQLNATASVAGTFAYSPALGTVLAAGSQTLSVTFTPTDTTDYTTATATVTLVVNQASQTISFSPSSPVTYRAPPISLIATGGGSDNPVTFSVVSGPGTVSGTTLTITGAGTIVVTASQAGNANYAAASPVTASIVIAQAAQAISFSPSSPVTFRAAPITLIATGGGSGNPVTFSVVSGPGTVSGSTLTMTGAGTIVVTANQAGNANYLAASPVTASIVIAQATPTVNWTAPSAITYGTALGASQLRATSPLPGTFVYSPAAGTVLSAGSQTLSVTFTPTDTTDYTTATVTVQLQVKQATSTISWRTPTAIPYGTALGAAQLHATSNVAGAFAYSPAAGTVPTTGSQTLSVTFTPTDATDYTSATSTVTLVVNKATPAINWNAPAAIPYGTPLGASQLDATSTVAGSFAYTPAAGTVLATGSQTLSVTFTPTDAANYNAATATVTLTVNQAAQTITFTPLSSPVTYGVAPIALSAKGGASGNPVTFAVTGPATVAGSALTIAGTGSVVVTASQAGNSNYTAATPVTQTVVVNQASSTTVLTAASTTPTQTQADLLTATVSGSGTIGGTVIFSAGGSKLCTSSLTAGAATCSFAPPSAGSVMVAAQYQGGADHLASSGAITLNVQTLYDASISLQLASTTLVYPGSTNVTACVTSAVKAAATGSVEILDGTAVLTTLTLNGDGCAYWYIAPGLNAGAHSVSAVYSGDKNNPAGTSVPVVVTVSPVPVNLSISQGSTSIPYGVSFRRTVSASSNAGAPQGSITYSLAGGAPATVALSSGNANSPFPCPRWEATRWWWASRSRPITQPPRRRPSPSSSTQPRSWSR